MKYDLFVNRTWFNHEVDLEGHFMFCAKHICWCVFIAYNGLVVYRVEHMMKYLPCIFQMCHCQVHDTGLKLLGTPNFVV